MAPTDQHTSSAGKIGESVANVLRGFLIGLAELVPGISGGTVALVVGIYERALDAGMQLMGSVKALFTSGESAGKKARGLDWWLLIPVGVGMIIAVFSMAGVMHTFVTEYEQTSRALFLGMVAMSLYVPLSMAQPADLKAKPWVWVAFVISAVATFFATGFTSSTVADPSYPVIFFAASIAVIALILPGVSGSYLLLAMGLYAPVMGAVDERQWDVMIVFALGAIVGLALFIRIMSYLLSHHRTVTVVVMAGLMLGSLRALWPWQDADAALLAPPSAGEALAMLGWFALGVAIVGITILAERRFHRTAA
ncbi:DUF368 domain-containing protein [Corynebacterium yudongzhengii]|uniref:DUF368 domain-containing protein n=1 Tax=Corynebacterium yudongzhengii TaxID=2080740 RepID=A0A2U1T6R0_9CORY|nr:DUF368 domain-containing protein [Corynebacterium yudongzhengii]AWB82238.1 DUF368 domain-containing protein [Corynebacterium yudongzhengii]PWC01687.1 DUF368 domain-containing protein [Corynebacterium yudongzhengii]